MKNDSLYDQVYARVLAILNDQVTLSPEKISVSRLAENLEVSRTPVTMALVRLEAEKLIQRSPDGGWVTHPITLKDIEEIFELREVMEPPFMVKVVGLVTPKLAADLLEAVVDMEKAAQENDLDRWLESDERYHTHLFSAVDNSRYQNIHRQLNSQIFKLKLGQMVIGERMAISAQQHRDMTEAIAAGNAELTEALTRKHISSLKTSLVHLVKNILLPILGKTSSINQIGPLNPSE